MDYEDLNKLRVRISRLVTAIGSPSGQGVQQNYSEDGVLKRSKFIGCKSPQELREELEGLAISIWNLKDYIQVQLKALGHDPNDVEQYVNGTKHLPLCADIANSAKHGILTSTRSGRKARLSQVSISHRTGFRPIPSDTPDFDTYYITDDPSQVQYKAPVVDENDAYIGDAVDILSLGSQEWENYFSSHPFLLKPRT
jgi:hypothetical protein